MKRDSIVSGKESSEIYGAPSAFAAAEIKILKSQIKIVNNEDSLERDDLESIDVIVQ